MGQETHLWEEAMSTTPIKILHMKGGVEKIRYDHSGCMWSWYDHKYFVNTWVNFLNDPTADIKKKKW